LYNLFVLKGVLSAAMVEAKWAAWEAMEMAAMEEWVVAWEEWAVAWEVAEA